MRKNNKKGFTLAELLIVVAIIAVLVAIAIPVFTSQLAKSELATDTANVRGVYAEECATALADGKMANDGTLDLSGKLATIQAAATKSTVSYDEDTHTITITHNKNSSIDPNTFTIDEDVTLN